MTPTARPTILTTAQMDKVLEEYLGLTLAENRPGGAGTLYPICPTSMCISTTTATPITAAPSPSPAGSGVAGTGAPRLRRRTFMGERI